MRQRVLWLKTYGGIWSMSRSRPRAQYDVSSAQVPPPAPLADHRRTGHRSHRWCGGGPAFLCGIGTGSNWRRQKASDTKRKACGTRRSCLKPASSMPRATGSRSGTIKSVLQSTHVGPDARLLQAASSWRTAGPRRRVSILNGLLEEQPAIAGAAHCAAGPYPLGERIAGCREAQADRGAPPPGRGLASETARRTSYEP